MKLIHKLILGFLTVTLMVGAIGGISLYQLSVLADPLDKDMSEIIETIKEISHLDGLAEFIRYYDEVLTQSARNYAFTQDNKWRKRYKDIEPKLDKAINEAIKKGDEGDRDFFSSVNNANIALVRMEYKSIEFVDNGHNEEAIKILDSREYWRQKKIYEQGLINYVHKRGAQYNEVLEASTDKINLLHSRSHALFKESRLFVLIFVTISVILAIGIGVLVYYSISKPLHKLKVAATKIGNGELDISLEIHSKDELGELASSFNKMAEDLQTITASRDELNKEIFERKRMEEKLQTLSITDELTGLYNRRGFFALANQELMISNRMRKGGLLLYADLNNLKAINDKFGHEKGDLLLIKTANLLKDIFRESDIIARIGGDEFVLFSIGNTRKDVETLRALLEKGIGNYNNKRDHIFKISISVGIVYCKEECSYSIDELLAQADQLMYENKKHKEKANP